jgi:hypothetical protein
MWPDGGDGFIPANFACMNPPANPQGFGADNGGGPGKAQLKKKALAKYNKLVQRALNDLFNPECMSFLASKGIDLIGFAGSILSQNAYDGKKSTIAQGEAGVGITAPSESIAKGFNRPGVNAAASITQPDAYFVGSGLREGTIEHEALHNFTHLGDTDLQALLGLPLNVNDTTNITQALKAAKCTK